MRHFDDNNDDGDVIRPFNNSYIEFVTKIIATPMEAISPEDKQKCKEISDYCIKFTSNSYAANQEFLSVALYDIFARTNYAEELQKRDQKISWILAELQNKFSTKCNTTVDLGDLR